ncbi:sugar phosphate isomerase/epimerase family protein [Paraglaciecola sp.]|uniref:sugar phosphate isomerase/epimerase family protein n=1 Tax=Paraglaciecola sp. TaxID=1920173 RepID=UPI003263A749
MNIEFGMMQGRLTPRYQGRYQCHPNGHWQSEFFVAKSLGLSLIEFIVDSWYLEDNPLLSHDGLAELQKISDESGVRVKTLCADVFMDMQFIGNSAAHALKLLNQLITISLKLGIRDIVIPCVDRSSLQNFTSKTDEFVRLLKPVCQYASSLGIRLNLETDLPPKPFNSLLNMLGRDNIWVNYDIGNSASLGFCPDEEFTLYGDRISNVHIKDRTLNGGSVILGTGDANFQSVIAQLKSINFSGPLIFQAARAESFIDDLTGVRKQINWFTQQWY